MFNYKMTNGASVFTENVENLELRQKTKYIESFCTSILRKMAVPVVAVCISKVSD